MRPRSMARAADRHDLYERAVQDPEGDAETLAGLYRRFRKQEATTLREDFCGTAALSTAWVKARSDRRAVGIDLDEPTMAWGRRRHIEPAGESVAQRIELHRADVLDGVGAAADVVCALNFSYQVFKRRSDLLAYFRAARARTRPGGMLVLDVLGGWESMRVATTTRKLRGYTYRWEQARFDPLTHEFVCHIHFDFPDGSTMNRAFTYDWRLWTVPELRDLLAEAGFSRTHAMWERTDAQGEGTGALYEPKIVDNCACWWTYLVAER